VYGFDHRTTFAGCTVSGGLGRLCVMPEHTPSDEFRHRTSEVGGRTVFDLYQETIARGVLAYAMDDGDKYRLVARSLRERAIVPEMAFQRMEVIGLAARFEVMAIEADHIQEHLVDTIFQWRSNHTGNQIFKL
jgi:hypothetical protein